MAVPEQTPYIEHTGNGVTTSFSLGFQCESKDYLIVLVDEIEPPIATWSLIGGNVVFTTAPAAGKKITLQRNTPFGRTTNYQSFNNSFRPQSVNGDFDRVWLKMQELGVSDSILKAFFLNEIKNQGVAVDQLNTLYSDFLQRLSNVTSDKNWDAAFVAYKDGNQFLFNEAQIETNEKQLDKNSLSVDLLDFIPKSEWTRIQNNTSNFDCTPSLVQAIATGKKVTIGQSGTYKLNTAYSGTTNFELEATAPDVVLDGNDNRANYVITNSGSVSKLTATFTNPSKFDISITLSDVTGLKVGDWLCFYCPTDFSYSEWRNIYRAGEWKQIRSIVGNLVWFTKPFYDSYAGLTLNLYKLNSVTCKLKNLKLLRTNGLSGFAKFSFSSDAVDENIELDVKVREGILYDRCINQKSINAKGANEGTGTGTDNDYGIVYANCQHTRVHNADIYSRRHAIALGGGNDICSVPVSDFRCYTSVLSCDLAVGVGAADMHGNIRDSSYEDCIIYGGTNIGGGEDTYYRRCVIHSDIKGVCGFAREILGGNMGWVDCEYHSNGNPQPTGQAVISFGGNDVTTITEKTKKDVTIEVSGKVFGGKSYGSAVSFAKIRNRGASKKINAVLDGLIFNNTSKFAYILNMDVVSGIANSDKIIVDNISGNMPTDNLVYAPETITGQSYLNKPMRLQKVAGKVLLNTGSGLLSVSDLANYPFIYPRRPLTTLTPRGLDGAQKSTFGGQRSVTFGVYSQAFSSFTAFITCSIALTPDDVIELAYSSEIREC